MLFPAVAVLHVLLPDAVALVVSVALSLGFLGVLTYPLFLLLGNALLEGRGRQRRLRRLKAAFERNGGAKALLEATLSSLPSDLSAGKKTDQ